MADQCLTKAARSLRHFNRFFTAQIGVLDRDILGTGHSLAEARVLYELSANEALTAGDLTRTLALDAGYLSRILARFRRDGLIERRRSPDDGRVTYLVLTKKGRETFAMLDRLSQAAAEAVVAPLGTAQRNQLVTALGSVETALNDKPETGKITLRSHRVGDMGMIVHRQADLYARDYGWDSRFEALLCEIAAHFLQNFDPERERCWVAERSGDMVGSVMLVKHEPSVAKLRLLYVEPSARGQGLGRRLVDACVGFAREKGYERIDLWTNSILTAARRIYEQTGFTLTAEEPHELFGDDLLGQSWSLSLR